jgi:hypothetical protein
MSVTLAFTERAAHDITDAFDWYEAQRSGLADVFLLANRDCHFVVVNGGTREPSGGGTERSRLPAASNAAVRKRPGCRMRIQQATTLARLT